MRQRPALFPILGVSAVALTRLLFRSHFLYDLDSVNFALGMHRFDPAAHQPHPPGYFLYVVLARWINGFLSDPNNALVAISIAASCGAAWMVYVLTNEWFGRPAARISLVLFLVSPLGWFHGIVALTYMVEAFFSALLGYLCWQICSGRRAYALPASVVFALAAGFRPSTALLLCPMWLFALWQVRGRLRWLALATGGVAMLAWFVPMTAAAGGFRQYFAALQHLWSTIPGKRTTLQSGWLAVARFLTIGWMFVVCFGAGAFFVYRGDGTKPTGVPAQWKRFTAVWVVPGLLFFTFVFFNYINSGYLLVLAPPAFAWLAGRIQAFIEARYWFCRPALVLGLALNCAFFLFAPVYCSYRSVRLFEQDLALRTRDLRQNLNPSETLIIGFDSHFLGYRHAGFYLPEFETAQYPEVVYPEGPRVFVMNGGDTQLVRLLRPERFQRFVLYPMPAGANYSEYLDGVLAKLPKGTLTLAPWGPAPVWSGPISALPLLFPTAAR